MKTSYKKGDIVELLNYEIPDSGRIGYFMNQYGMVPQVGHKYYVAYDSEKYSVSLICGEKAYFGKDLPKTFHADMHEVCLYKAASVNVETNKFESFLLELKKRGMGHSIAHTISDGAEFIELSFWKLSATRYYLENGYVVTVPYTDEDDINGKRYNLSRENAAGIALERLLDIK